MTKHKNPEESQNPQGTPDQNQAPLSGDARGEVQANGHPHLLDIREPTKWQMKIREYLATLEPFEAESWMEGVRLITTMSSRVIRDRVYAKSTRYCAVCDRPFKDGKPACEDGYYDADREYIKLYGCDPSEFPELMRMVKKKADALHNAEDRANKAARQAAIDARRSINNAGKNSDT